MYPFAPCKGIWIPILGDPGADSGDEGKSKRAGKCGTYTFFHPFRLSLAHFICPWVSEDAGFRNPWNFCLRTPESLALEPGIQRKESESHWWTYQCKAGVGGGAGGRRLLGGDLAGLSWPWGRALDRSCSTGRGNFESFFALRGTDVGIFDCWLGRKRLRPNSHASRMRRTVWKDMKIVKANENKPKWVVLINWTFQDTVVSK